MSADRDQAKRSWTDYVNLRGGSELQDVSLAEWEGLSEIEWFNELREAWLGWTTIASRFDPKPTMISTVGKRLAADNLIETYEAI